jgi:ABC-type transport system involved in multi-copper enzyme maturation permease subunit
MLFGFANARSVEVDGDTGNAVGFNPLFPLVPVAVWLWGIPLVARERAPNTLVFLAGAPVSRREIAVTSFSSARSPSSG